MNTKYHHRWASWVMAAGLASLAVVQTGCVVVAVGAAGVAGAGAVAYVRGDLQASLPNGYESVVRASSKAIYQLQFKKVEDNHDALKAVLVARTADDKKVEITVTRESDENTKVVIRVGFFGDQALSMTILEKIKAAL